MERVKRSLAKLSHKKIEKEHIIVMALLLVIFFLLLAYFVGHRNGEVATVKIVREPAVAGTFYPGSASVLGQLIDEYLNQAEPPPVDNVRAIIVPHAGYIYSGPTAAYGFRLLQNHSFRTVIVLAQSHYSDYNGYAIANVTHYKTPLGEIPLSEKVAQLRKEKSFTIVDDKKEHVIEVELPFLQKTLGDFELIPILIGRGDPHVLADILQKYLDDDTLIVVSTDLSHYYPYGEAQKLDAVCTSSVPSLNFSLVTECQACSLDAVVTAMYLAQKNGWQGQLLDYRNSGDTAGDKNRVVGYMSVAFFSEEPGSLNTGNQEFLMKLARQTVESYVREGQVPEVDETALDRGLTLKKGCFVTLEKNGQLRGCIGHIIPQEALYECVIANAVNAAVNDARFERVTPDELKDIKLEISVLTVPQEVPFSSGDDLKEKLRPEVDGVILQQGLRQATYLPQVWEMFSSADGFLSSLCEKGWMSADCWKDPKTKVLTYQAQVFGE